MLVLLVPVCIVWPSLVQYGPVWIHLTMFGPTLSTLSPLAPFHPPCLAMFLSISPYFAPFFLFYPVLPHFTPFGSALPHLFLFFTVLFRFALGLFCPSFPHFSRLALFGTVWHCLAPFCPICPGWPCLVNFGSLCPYLVLFEFDAIYTKYMRIYKHKVSRYIKIYLWKNWLFLKDIMAKFMFELLYLLGPLYIWGYL